MTDTVLIPSYVSMECSEQPLPALAQIATDLLVQADLTNLPGPRYVSVGHGGQHISFGFGRDLDACHALAQWAERFGGTVTGKPYQGDDGPPQVFCQVAFIYGGARVELSAFIEAEPATT